MKKLLFAVTIAFFLFSCDNGEMGEDLFDGDNPFIGTWDYRVQISETEWNNSLRWVFTETTATEYWALSANNFNYNMQKPEYLCSYTYTDTQVILIPTDEQVKSGHLVGGNPEENYMLKLTYDKKNGTLDMNGVIYKKVSKQTVYP